MASIKAMKNKDGKVTGYKIIVSLGYDANGKKISKSCTFHPTKKSTAKIPQEVKEFANKYELEVKSGAAGLDGEKMRFEDYVNFWDEQYLSIRVLSGEMTQRCREDYLRSLRIYAIPKIGHMKLSEIKAVHIDGIINDMIKTDKSPKTCRNVFNVIRACFDYAFKKDVIVVNPCAKCDPLPKNKKKTEPQCFQADEVRRFLHEALTMEYEIPIKGHQRRYTTKGSGAEFYVHDYTEHRSISLQFKTFFTLAVCGGFRRGELCALKWEDIDFENQTIRIDEAISYSKNMQTVKDPKTNAGNRTNTLPSGCFDLLRELKTEQMQLSESLKDWKGQTGKDYDQNYVFIQADGQRMNVQTPSYKFKKILEAYNKTVPEEKRLPIIRLHDLRHTCASHLMAIGINVQDVSKYMGHSKPSFTEDTYGHPLDKQDAAVARAIGDAFDI